ncbi:MAG: hypothetical protein LBT02_01080 [Rickettsiales bacterium]|jgi:hypothetical protein|nr:hypothetical protein [Rickettsiales bacterium]
MSESSDSYETSSSKAVPAPPRPAPVKPVVDSESIYYSDFSDDISKPVAPTPTPAPGTGTPGTPRTRTAGTGTAAPRTAAPGTGTPGTPRTRTAGTGTAGTPTTGATGVKNPKLLNHLFLALSIELGPKQVLTKTEKALREKLFLNKEGREVSRFEKQLIRFLFRVVREAEGREILSNESLSRKEMLDRLLAAVIDRKNRGSLPVIHKKIGEKMETPKEIEIFKKIMFERNGLGGFESFKREAAARIIGGKALEKWEYAHEPMRKLNGATRQERDRKRLSAKFWGQGVVGRTKSQTKGRLALNRVASFFLGNTASSVGIGKYYDFKEKRKKEKDEKGHESVRNRVKRYMAWGSAAGHMAGYAAGTGLGIATALGAAAFTGPLAPAVLIAAPVLFQRIGGYIGAAIGIGLGAVAGAVVGGISAAKRAVKKRIDRDTWSDGSSAGNSLKWEGMYADCDLWGSRSDSSLLDVRLEAAVTPPDKQVAAASLHGEDSDSGSSKSGSRGSKAGGASSGRSLSRSIGGGSDSFNGSNVF